MVAVDEFELVGSAPDGDSPAPRRSGRSGRSRRATPWLATAAALVVVGATVATPTPLIAGRGDGPDFGLTDLDLAQAPTVVWTSSLANGWVTDARGDRAVVVNEDTGTSRVLTGVDLGDGSQVWSYEDTTGSCQQGPAFVCVEDAGSDDAEIVTIALEDGAQTRRPHPGAYSAIAVGDGSMVVVERTDTSEEDIVRVDADGAEIWHRSADATDTSGTIPWTWLQIVSGALWLGQSQTRIDLQTGVESGDPNRWIMRDGTLVTSEDDQLTIWTREGPVTVSQVEALSFLDDDLGGVVRVTADDDGRLTGALRDTGAKLWHLERAPCDASARLEGVVVVACWDESGATVLGIDEVTGETLWVRSDLSLTPLASRDTLVYVTDTGDGALGIDPTDGTTRWQLPLSQNVTGGWSPTPISDGLLVMTGDSMVRLAWD